jgi:hypothetical protein
MATKPSGLSKGLTKKKSGSKKSSKSKKRVKHTHIEHGEDGSHVVRHSFDQGGPDEEPTPDAVHGLSDNDALAQHMQDQFPPSPEMAAGGAASAPAGAPAGPAPGGM